MWACVIQLFISTKNVASPNTFISLEQVYIELHGVALVNLFLLTVLAVGGINTPSGLLSSFNC